MNKLLLLLISFLFITFGCKKNEDVSIIKFNSEVPFVGLLDSFEFFESLNVKIARLGTVDLKDSHSTFLSKDMLGSLKQDLKASIALNPDSPFKFAHCEQAMYFERTSDSSQCDYLIEDKNTTAEFIFLPSNGEKICTSLANGCKVHQVVKLHYRHNQFQRAAIFIEKEPAADLTLLMVRPHVSHDEIVSALVPGQNFGYQASSAVPSMFGFEGETHYSLVNLYTSWLKKNKQIDLNIARKNAFLTFLTVWTGASAFKAAQLLRVGGGFTKMAKLMSVLDLAANVSVSVNSALKVAGARKYISGLPPGPHKTMLQSALLITEAAGYLGTINLSVKVVQGAVKAVTSLMIAGRLADTAGVTVYQLSKEIVKDIRFITNRNSSHLHKIAMSGNNAELARHINEMIIQVQKAASL